MTRKSASAVSAPPATRVRPRGSQNAAGEETRTTILDVAERICAGEGFEALSVRAISEAAGVNLAAITYHFGGKSQLFEEMFRRRVVPLNDERLALLDAALASGAPTLEAVVRAFVEPPMKLTAAINARSNNSALVVMQFLSRAFAMPGENEFLQTYYEPVRSRFILALKHFLPKLPLEEVIWRYNLMVGGIIYAMGGWERMERPPAAFASAPLPHAQHRPDDMVDRMVRFFLAGLLAE
ncbi:MAG: TetR family transcriptional regulator [Burkholderiales bacterium]|nr:TetR family transcriptional regulator [Burkholderiales bacterium]